MPISVCAADGVVLLHGIARSDGSMRKMEKFLSDAGFEVSNIKYPSTSKNLNDIAGEIDAKIKGLSQRVESIHFVTHSMGGLVVRKYLQRLRPQNLGRVVMLAPPNQGSEVADFLERHIDGIFKIIYGPARLELTTYADIGGVVDYELGIIAGSKSINPLSSWIIEGVDDGSVAVERTKIDGMKEHKIVDTNHTFIMRNREVMQMTLSFLQTGMFEQADNAEVEDN